MLALIARKELLEMWREGRVRWSCLLLSALLVVAALSGWHHHRETGAMQAWAAAGTRAHWLSQPPKNPHSAAHYGVYAFKPAQPLSYVDRGIEPFTGTSAWLEAHKRNEPRYRPAQDATSLARFGEWSAAMVLQLLVPLVIIMLAFPAIAGEREQGTFRQVLSLGVRPWQLAFGKALGVAGAIGLLLVPVVLLGALALVVTGGDGRGAGASLRFWLLAAFYATYFTIFLGLSIAISAQARSARHALILLLALWSGSALLAPRVAADVARAARPVESMLEFNLALEARLQEHAALAPEIRDSVLRAHGVSSVDSLPFNYSGLSLLRSEAAGDVVFDSLYGALHARLRQQSAVHEAVGVLAPTVAIQTVSMALAGTDWAEHKRFTDSAEVYRRRLNLQMNQALMNAPRGPDGHFQATADSALWSSVPPFDYESPSPLTSLGAARASAAVLGAWLVLACALAVWSLNRVRPEFEVTR